MKRTNLCTVIAVIAVWPLNAQPQEPLPTFDAASVKLHADDDPLGTMMQERPGTIFYRRTNLLTVIRRAYDVQFQQVVGPPWLSTERYDIEAKLPADTPVPRLQLMLQSLLADRFRVQMHREKKELPAYSMEVAREGFKMHRSEGGELGYGPSRDASGNHLRGKITLQILANLLSGVLGHPVLNQTELEGLYDVALDYTEDAQAQDTTTFPGLITAMRQQLGLKIESKKALFDMIVIDRVEKVPTGN
jgi:uncharacterized protein (TIGR03435 family)